MREIINEGTVLDFYLEQMDNDNITFLKNKKDSKAQIRELIKELNELPDIHQKIQTAKELWKILFEESMSTINPDKRGYDRLFKYFDAYVDFEELIFASDSFYRDHTLHCLWVYFLGEYLYSRDEFKSIFKYIFEDDLIVYEMEELSKEESLKGIFDGFIRYTKHLNNVMQKSDALRCLSAITHDLGYPLNKIKKINKSIGNILPFFGIHNFSEFDFAYTNEQNISVKSFLEILSSDVYMDVAADEAYSEIINKVAIAKNEYGLAGFDKEALLACTEEEKTALKKFFNPRVEISSSVTDFSRYGEDFENYEHGIMSAFILYKTLMNNKAFRFIGRKSGAVNNHEVDLEMLFALNIIYTSNADHTSPSYKINAINNPSAFLILVDELEEFSRISRANQNRQYISEFCKSSIYMENDVFCVDFIFDNKDIVNLDPERAFKGRCAKKLNLFDIAQLDKDFKLKLRCIDALGDVDKVYEISIAHKYAKITIDDVEQNIPAYLKTRELYSREEYAQL